MPVFDATTGEPLPVESIEAALRAICEASPKASAPGLLSGGSAPSLAILTTCGRDEWAQLRASLEAHAPANRCSLRRIDDALFCLSLDEADLGTVGGAEPQGPQLVHAERLALCGDSRLAPRWMDKAFSLAVTADGVPTFHFEHSWGDGICVARAGGETMMAIAKDQLPHRTASAGGTEAAGAAGAAGGVGAAGGGSVTVAAVEGSVSLSQWRRLVRTLRPKLEVKDAELLFFSVDAQHTGHCDFTQVE